MTGSYKVALVGSLVLFAIVVGYYLFQDSPEPNRPVVDEDPVAVVDDVDDEPMVGPRTLSDMARSERPTGPVPSSSTPGALVTRPTPDSSATAGAAPSQADVLRARLLASQRAATGEPSGTDTTGTPSTSVSVRDALGSGTASATAATTGSSNASPSGTPGAPATGSSVSTPGSAASTSTSAAATAASRSTTTPARPRTYTVQAGDTLSSIATKLYGSERSWVDIAQANPTVDPIRLKVGQVLKVPTREQIRRAEEPAAAAPGRTIQYTVRSGDTLSSIAQQYYGDPTEWRYIFNANRDKLGSNPDAIRAGMQITVPPVPRAAQ